MIYKIFTTLDASSCEKKLREILNTDVTSLNKKGQYYFGDIDPTNKNFWIINSFNDLKTSRSKIKVPLYRKFQGELQSSNKGTRIIGQFMSLKISKLFWSIWYITLTLLMTIFIYQGLLDYAIYGSIDGSIIKRCLVSASLAVLGWIVLKLSTRNQKNIEDSTLELLKNLLQGDKEKDEEYYNI